MQNVELDEVVQTIENLLVARATGSAASNEDYLELRQVLLGDPSLRELLPAFLRTARSLPEFLAQIKRDYSGYQERRLYIWGAFQLVHEFLRLPEGSERPAENAAESLATVVPQESNRTKTTRAFISYSSKDRVVAARVKDLLLEHGIECFVAHDDLQVSEEWKERILEELLACDIFVPLLSEHFRSSDWGAQEIGVISGRRGVAIVPLSIDGTVPFGFISSVQGKGIPALGPTPDLVIAPLLRKFPRLILPGMIGRVRSAGSFRGAEAAMRPLVPYFDTLTDGELISLLDAAIENNQVWSAGECRSEHLPRLIEINRSRIPLDRLQALQFQIENDRRYVPARTEI
jgi:hypothetical protein